MKKFNVVAKKVYVKNNEEKTAWLRIGTITEFDNGNQILELNMFPAMQYNIFKEEKDNRERAGNVKSGKHEVNTQEIEDRIAAEIPAIDLGEDIKEEDLPF